MKRYKEIITTPRLIRLDDTRRNLAFLRAPNHKWYWTHLVASTPKFIPHVCVVLQEIHGFALLVIISLFESFKFNTVSTSTLRKSALSCTVRPLLCFWSDKLLCRVQWDLCYWNDKATFFYTTKLSLKCGYSIKTNITPLKRSSFLCLQSAICFRALSFPALYCKANLSTIA